MKKNSIIFTTLILGVSLCGSCAGKPSIQEGQPVQSASEAGINPADFSEVLEKTWELIEVKRESDVVIIERQRMADMYTLRFADGALSGKGAPNSYHGYYKQGNSHDISFGAVVSTKMALLQEPEALKEHDYFAYLDKIIRWEISSGQLNLFTANEHGEIVLVFNEVEDVD
ncbi:MAG: META domain-containing protein [Treponema sp.]|nr:META domain-containing protein [Treponema sp.]